MTQAEKARRTHADRLRRVESFTDAALAHLSFEDLLVELLDRVREVLDADTAAILLFDRPSNSLIATAARGIEEEVRQGVRIPVGRGFAGKIAAERRPVIIRRVDHTNVLNPILREKGIRSLLGVPLLSAGSFLGVLHVGTLTERVFTAEDAELLQMAGDRIALVTQATVSTLERSTALALQRSLVPARLPDLPGLHFASRYAPGEGGGVGGDWYDVFTLPSGWLCVVVGDVAGRGLPAAVVMGRLRSALRAYALETRDPADVLGRLDRKLSHFEPGELATVQCAMIEPSLDRLHISSAGHLPPAFALPGAPAELLEVPCDPPIGVRHVARRRSLTLDLPHDATLCFYTDGLVERRGESIDVGLERVRAAVDPMSTAEALCATLMSVAVGGLPHEDDIAVLVMQRRAARDVRDLDLTVPSIPTSLAEIRAAVRRWLSTAGAPRDVAEDMLVAIGEACSNAIEHAYGPGGGTVQVRLVYNPPEVVATIRDSGEWRPPRGSNRGRGTALMHALSDGAEIDHSPDGTTVTLRKVIGDGDRP